MEGGGLLMNDVIIIGGGIAGLSAAIHCRQRGLMVTVLERGAYPAHKICGEFLSPECLPMLAAWGVIPSIAITTVQLYARHAALTLPLPLPAGSMSRYVLDASLAEVARQSGVTLHTNAQVDAVTHDAQHNIYDVTLADGSVMRASSLVIGAGRVAQLLLPRGATKAVRPDPSTHRAPSGWSERLRTVRPDGGAAGLQPRVSRGPNGGGRRFEWRGTNGQQYVGIKAHFSAGSFPLDSVQFFITDVGYLGISAVDATTVNVAALLSASFVHSYNNTDDAIDAFISQPIMNRMRDYVQKEHCLFPQWLTCQVPAFGMRSYPVLKNIYYIGDAAGSIPPATGDGLALGLLTGAMVAPYVAAHDAQGFAHAWRQQFSSVFKNGMALHRLYQYPAITALALRAAGCVPALSRAVFLKTRDTL